MRSVFEFRKYRPYLEAALANGPKNGRGKRTQLARALGCHSGYLSRVFAGIADLSVEQALSTTRFLGHTPDESSYFLLLVQHERAGTRELKEHWLRQIEAALARHLEISHRARSTKRLPKSDQATYYSSWHYAAIHMATASPALCTVDSLSRYFALPPAMVARALGFLSEMGLVREADDGFRIGQTHLHLDKGSDQERAHHASWRFRAVASLDRTEPSDLHYSSVISCSREALPLIKQALVDAIEKARATVRESEDEAVFCYALDLFEAGTP